MWTSIKRLTTALSDRAGHVQRQALAAGLMASAAVPAWAQSAGVSGFFGNLGTATRNFISMVTIVAVGIGVAAVLYGIVMMIKKGMGRGDDIEWRQIIWPLVGGALATVVMFVVYALVAEIGANQGQMGQGW